MIIGRIYECLDCLNNSPSLQYCISPNLQVHKSGEPWERAWFEYNSYKIPGRQVPMGILAHAHVPEEERPWRLTVHFAGYPDECCPFTAKTRKLDLNHMFFNPKHMFFNSLKEAFVIMMGTLCTMALASNTVTLVHKLNRS